MSTPTHTTAQHAERRTRQRPALPACKANHCHQGRRAYPCPQACELPAPTTTADPLGDEPASAMELLALALGVVAVVLIVVFAIKACATA